jgi:zinc/manganese transport system substrate-binding protein
MRRFLISLIIVSWLLTACQAVLPSQTGNKLKVVATFSVLGDFVQNVGGDRIELTTLVGPGVDTHTYEPTPADSAALADARLVFENGLGFETWLDKLYTASDSKSARVVVTKAVKPRVLTEGDEQGETDPHAWHDVTNAISMVEAIREALVQADPTNAQAYQTNAQAYLEQLQELNAWVKQQVTTLPAERRKLVTTHDTFGYFAQQYGFEILGTLLPTSTEGASPSAQEIAALVEKVKAAGVPAVFSENVSSNALLKQVADEAGVKVIVSLYTDALGEPGSQGDTYLRMERFNVATIVEALKDVNG